MTENTTPSKIFGSLKKWLLSSVQKVILILIKEKFFQKTCKAHRSKNEQIIIKYVKIVPMFPTALFRLSHPYYNTLDTI